MAKKKKTRQQKIIADLRRQLLKEDLSSQKSQKVKFNTPQVNIPQEIPQKKEFPIETAVKKENGASYNYLIHDLRKTAMLTASVIALQIILFLVLTNKILVLPGLSY
jgi:hypothetical protein